MDNYVDCTQYPSIYETLPAIYDLWRHQWELLNDTKQPDSALLLTPVSDLYLTSEVHKNVFISTARCSSSRNSLIMHALIMHQFWTRKECKGSLFLQAGNICNSLKNFSRYFSNFSWKMMFISLVVFTVPLQQTMKWKGMAKNANNERGWQKIQTIKKDGEKWKGLRPMQIIWDKRGSQVKWLAWQFCHLQSVNFAKLHRKMKTGREAPGPWPPLVFFKSNLFIFVPTVFVMKVLFLWILLIIMIRNEVL